MSHFYGLVTGSGKTKATRGGTKNSGITGCVASWTGAIRTELWYAPEEDVNKYSVIMIPWRGIGGQRIMATGTVGEFKWMETGS